jgi:hypothetical protein
MDATSIGLATASGVANLLGTLGANRANRRESARNRLFVKEMASTQWQRTVDDLEAAGLNPALAYSRGPNAAPGGSTAQQVDAAAPALSSAMQVKRLKADLDLVEQQARKVRLEGNHAKAMADAKVAENMALGIGVSTKYGDSWIGTPDGSIPLFQRIANANAINLEQTARRTGLLADISDPLAGLSRRFGEFLPPLAAMGAAATLNPGGLFRGASLARHALRRRSGRRPITDPRRLISPPGRVRRQRR